MTIGQNLLSIPREDLFTSVKAPEYKFHALLEEGKLEEFLARFPEGKNVYSSIINDVFNPGGLSLGWENDLMNEINSLIEIQNDVRLKRLTNYKYEIPNHSSNEMGILVGALTKIFTDNRLNGLSQHEMYFLDEFFYGIQHSFWTKFAIIIKYTTIELNLETILRASRNKISFTIDGQTLALQNLALLYPES